MRAVLLSIGDEILNGTTVNSNAAWIATQIQPLGFDILEILAISDKAAHITAAMDRYIGVAELIITTGGLGPTKDDITKKTLNTYFDGTLQLHADILERLQQAFAKRNIPFTENNVDQAMYPDSCTILPNPLGTAQGMLFERNNTTIICLPGVPFEMQGLMENAVLPFLRERLDLPVIWNRHIMTSGMSESLLAKTIGPVEDDLPEYISLAYLPSPAVVKLRLTARGSDMASLRAETETYALRIRELLGNFWYADDAIPLEAHIGTLLRERNATLCTAESCTGGNIAHKITLIPGSSDYFKGSIICYAEEVKEQLLGVRPDTLQQYSAESRETVDEMLTGALRLMGTDYAIAVSGLAGPSAGKGVDPVGTIYIGVAGAGDRHIHKHFFNKNRQVNIEYATMFALHTLRLLLNNHLV
ncbi:MAG: CinA family nicotinamide mononucleotide deamidase-related protein [Chitinophagales bacterium]